MALVIWGASFNVNEKGHEYLQEARDKQQRINDINDMSREILYLIDIHGLLRKPTWDSVRLLLLVLPLTHGGYMLHPPSTISDPSVRYPEPQ